MGLEAPPQKDEKKRSMAENAMRLIVMQLNDDN